MAEDASASPAEVELSDCLGSGILLLPPPVSDPGFSRVTIPPFSGDVNIFHFLSPNLFLDIEFCNLVDGLGTLGLAEVDVGFAANFGAVSQDAGNDLHLQLLCKQQTRAGMAQHMAAAGRQIQGRSLQQISKSLFHLARCSGLPVGCGDHIAV